MKIELHQFLSRSGKFESKNKIIDALNNKEISIDGKITINPHYQLNPDKHKICYKQEVILAIMHKIYILMNKPEGFLSTRLTNFDREFGKKSIFELLRKDKRLNKLAWQTLFAVGRLDEDTSGLIIITNDGKLSHTVTHPSFNIEKKYECLLEMPITKSAIESIMKGIEINLGESDKPLLYTARPANIEKISQKQVIISIDEGKKREVRRIFQAVNNQVLKLSRISIGSLRLSELKIKEGDYVFVKWDFINKRIGLY